MSREAFTENAIILKLGVFREADCWVRLFSPGRGLFTAFAFGGYKSRKRFPGCLDVLNRVRFTVVSSRYGGYLSLNEGTLLDRFPRIHTHRLRLGMAANCCKFLEAAHIGSGSAQSVFSLFHRTLQVLDESSEVPASLPLLFRARLTAEYGYGPDFERCAGCGEEVRPDRDYLFSLQQGRTYCSRCGRGGGESWRLPGGKLLRVAGVLRSDPGTWCSDPGVSGLQGDSLRLMDGCVQRYMGLVWDGGRFRQA
jgi:DNA repair protein RecO (recombination protein O)